MRIPIRTSRLAIWARRLGAFAVPLLVLAIGLHLLAIIDAAAFEISLAIATGLGALAVLCAILAYVRIWYSGDQGWGKASMGLLAGLVALGPLGYAAVFVVTTPSTADISTSADAPPVLALRPEDADAVSLGRADLARAFPGVVARTYAVPPDALYALIEGLVGVRQWSVVRRIGPVGHDGTGALNVVYKTLLGWDNEMALRVSPQQGGSRLDLRAAPVREALHDLGLNGRVADAFLDDLDAVVAIYERDAALVFDDARAAAVQTGD